MAEHARESQPLELRTPGGRRLLAAAALATGVTFFDGDAITVALPDMAARLDVGIAAMQWVMNLFLLIAGAFLLVGGSIGDRYGRRRIFLVGTGVFGLGTVIAGAAPGLGVLLGARVVQGAGAALLVPVSLAVVSVGFVERDRGAAIGWWSGLTATSSMIGPVVGGSITDLGSWRAVFAVEAAVLALVLFLAVKHLQVPEADRSRRIDLAGSAVTAVAVGGIIFTAIQGRMWGFASPAVIAAAVAGVAGIPGLLIIEQRRRDPMLPLHLFRSPRFSAGNVVTAGIYFTFSGVLFVVVVTLQEALAYSPVAAGIAILPLAGLMVALSPVAGRLVDRAGPRLMLTAGPVTVAAGAAVLATLDPSGYVSGLLPGLLLFGLGMAVTVAPLTSTVLASVEARYESLASGANSAVARITGALAIAILPAASGFAIDLATPAMLETYRRALLVAAAVAAVTAAAGRWLPDDVDGA